MSDETRGDADDPREPIPPELPATEGFDAARAGNPGGRIGNAAEEQIGPYRLIEPLGEGGMGQVWLAEQTEPVKRRVALKVIKPGMDSRQVVARFEAERQALALMDHPAIAKVHDAGTTPRGLPYFVMEYVQGVPITQFCDERRLSNRKRLELFIRVCEGVQHAHQKAVIHRDLKPSNVLVTEQDGKPAPKIIDFGVAKAVSEDLTDKTIHTQLGGMIGTPAYMSPEQAAIGERDIDTRTDVYALGVMLYELLVGALPFEERELQQAGYEGMVKKIREQDPPRPSSRLSTLGATSTVTAERRGMQLPVLKRELSGDLDWITMRALEKERDRRYASPSEFAADVARFLNNEPVVAGPASATYQLRKLVARHKAPFALAGALFVLVSGFGLWMSLLYAQAEQLRREAVAAKTAEQVQRELAEKTAGELQQVSDFQAGMLAQIDPANAGAGLTEDVLARFSDALAEAGIPESDRAKLAAAFTEHWSRVNATDAARHLIDRTILEPAATAIDERFKDQPLVGAQLRQSLANLYRQLGLYHAAAALQASALDTRRRVLGDDHPETLASVNSMGQLLEAQGKLDEAMPFYREVLDGRRRILGDDDPLTLASTGNLGLLLQRQGKLDEAEAYFREAIEGDRRVLGDEHPETLTSLNNMGLLLHRQGKPDEAEPYYREALEGYRRILGDEHPTTLKFISNMGMLLREQGKLEDAELYLREALEGKRRVLGDEHPGTLTSVANLAFLFEQAGRYAEAEPYCRDALDGKRRVLGDDHQDTLISISNMGKLLVEVGKGDEAERLAREAVDRGKATLGETHWFVGNFLGKHGLALALLDRYAEAEGALLEGHGILVAALGENHEQTRRVVGYLADVYDAWDAAEPDHGHDARAAEWRGQMAREEAR